jgi:hypothetical protein
MLLDVRLFSVLANFTISDGKIPSHAATTVCAEIGLTCAGARRHVHHLACRLPQWPSLCVRGRLIGAAAQRRHLPRKGSIGAANVVCRRQ